MKKQQIRETARIPTKQLYVKSVNQTHQNTNAQVALYALVASIASKLTSKPPVVLERDNRRSLFLCPNLMTISSSLVIFPNSIPRLIILVFFFFVGLSSLRFAIKVPFANGKKKNCSIKCPFLLIIV